MLIRLTARAVGYAEPELRGDVSVQPGHSQSDDLHGRVRDGFPRGIAHDTEDGNGGGCGGRRSLGSDGAVGGEGEAADVVKVLER